MAPVTPLARVELANGRWLRLHLASVSQQLEIDGADTPTTNAGWRELFEKYLVWLDEACEETSWDGKVGDGIALNELTTVVTHWLHATEEVAFPLAQESGSETKSAEQPSEEPTAEHSQSNTPPSSKSSTQRANGRSRRGT